MSGQSAQVFRQASSSPWPTSTAYIEEMINGQKVVKVFCHEQKAIEEFDRRNDEHVPQRHRGQQVRPTFWVP